ncbi:MAG: hypothetical protein HYZ27_02975, partial [Deltaproteobacteria bacterium]|nr:hypothetical protein [Deltaproteobacteria bacterium]
AGCSVFQNATDCGNAACFWNTLPDPDRCENNLTCDVACGGLNEIACEDAWTCRWDGLACEQPTARWDQAVAVIDQVTLTHDADVRFGLSTYPRQCAGTPACALACNHCPDSCAFDCPVGSGTANYQAGQIDVPVADATRATILDLLYPPDPATYPGGGTPTGPTLRFVRDNVSTAGLDANDRNNAVILITDGEANGDGATVTGCAACGGTPSAGCACKVDAALDNLRMSDAACSAFTASGQAACESARCEWVDPNCVAFVPFSINTYVVGFAFSTLSVNLNCHAAHGGTARTSQCPGVTTGNCATQTNACYYEANDAAALATALDDIITVLGTCDYDLATIPPDENRLFVYHLYDNPADAPADCSNPTYGLCRLPRDTTQTDNWDYSVAANRVTFYGAACDTVKLPNVEPVVILGADIGEGGSCL